MNDANKYDDACPRQDCRGRLVERHTPDPRLIDPQHQSVAYTCTQCSYSQQIA